MPKSRRFTGELLLRYFCATLVTVVAAAGAQLVIRNDFALAIIALSLVGVPVSLYLRLHEMRVLGFPLSRPMWNALTVTIFFAAAGAWTLSSMSDLIGLLLSGTVTSAFWIHFTAEQSLELLMQVFLLFAALRSFALISDKDATLATVPSFSVLLLLIPVHKGIEVVLYFLLWTLAATTLFALDHRIEQRERASGRVPAVLPGQAARLAARGLAMVLGAALIASVSLSAFLTSRNADDQSATQTAIAGLAGRFAQFAMGAGESSIGGGAERQIDFSSGPSIPSRALLWLVRTRTSDDHLIRPEYFRLFALGKYNGSTWTQGGLALKRLTLAPISTQVWPSLWRHRFGDRYHDGRGRGDGHNPFFPGAGGGGGGRTYHNAPEPPTTTVDAEQQRMLDMFRAQNFAPPVFELPPGFILSKAWPQLSRTFGRPTTTLQVSVRANTTNLGFVPMLPGARALFARTVYVNDKQIKEVRAGGDGSMDLQVVQQEHRISSLCDVPRLAEYGFPSGAAPTKKVAPHADAPRLLPSERALCLETPNLSERTRHFAQEALAKTGADENNLARAGRLALAIDRGATYTLRPPIPPDGSEATDFFLFEGNRRGYCTHFASALAVLCRSQGIPARLVSGFAAQEYSSDGWAMLRGANAHAWTEVWIENWGWAPVDATPATDRGDNAPNLLAFWGDWLGFAFNQVAMWSRARVALLGFFVCAFVVSVYAFRRRERFRRWWGNRRGRLSHEEWGRREIIDAYETASKRLALVFRPRAPFETPDEWLAAARQGALDAPRARGFARHEFEQLTDYYLRARYAASAPDDSTVGRVRELAKQVTRGRNR